MKNKLIDAAGKTVAAIATILLALVIGAALIALSGNSPLEAYQVLFQGAFGSRLRISETFVKMVPLMLIALGTSVAYKSQLWNIGGDGQFIMGAIAATAIGLYVPLPTALLLPLTMIGAIVGGGLWAGLAGWLRTRFNANEVITTLMLNYIATYFLAFLVYGPMQDPVGYDYPQTAVLPEGLHLPLLAEGLRIHAGIFVAFIGLILVMLFWKSTQGYRTELVGQGNLISKYAGLDVNKTIIITMIISGAFAGIAGWSEVFGVQYRLLEGVSSGYGNLAVVIALLGGLNPIGITVASFFFSALLVGGATMQRMTEVPYSVVDIIQGLIIIFVITRTAFNSAGVKAFLARRKK